MNSPRHIVFSGGVTGGHLFPGLAVAQQVMLLAPETRITFCGPGGALDRREVERAGYAYLEVCCPRRPDRVWRYPRFARRMLQGQWAAAAFVRRNAVSAVVGLGSFGSAPMALAAARRRAPLVLLEQNAVLGRANRWLGRWAQAICLAFDETQYAQTGRANTLWTGTPIREPFCRPRGARDRRLVVLGGSGGARALNEAMPSALARLAPALQDWQVIHQSGANDQATTQAAYRAANVDATVVPFIVDMAETLGRAALVVCRAGGSTLAELAVTRTPALLVPFPRAVDDHQRHNAQRFEHAGAVELIDSEGLSPDALAGRLGESLARLLADERARQQMALAMATLARPDAARHVAEAVLGFADRESLSVGRDQLRPAHRVAISPALPTLD